MHDIMHLIKIHASSERLYQAITTTEGIHQWWTRDASIEPKVGGAGEFGFFGRRFVAKVIVEELNPVTRVRWKVINAAWPGRDIEFNLKADLVQMKAYSLLEEVACLARQQVCTC